MSEEMTKEQRVLRMMKKVLTDVARDTHVKPGIQHPLSDETIINIRECLMVISSRESEIAKESGNEQSDRPRFIDEPKTSFVVNIDKITKKDK